MALVATITYSGGTLTLNDSTNFVLQDEGYTPNVTFLRDADFGGVGAYAEIDEALNVLVNGSTAAARYQNLRKLQQAMDEATRWARGENLSAVLLNFAPDGASAGTLSSAIMGRPRGGENPFGTSNWYGAAANAIPDNALKFRRRGLWLGSEGSAASSATASNKVMTATFTAHPLPSPVRITISNVAVTGSPDLGQVGYLLLASGSSALQSLSFTSATYGSVTSTVAATGSHSGNVARMTPTALIGNETYFFDATDLATGIETATVIWPVITYRLKDVSAPSFTIFGEVLLADGTTIVGPTFTVSGAATSNFTIPLPLGAFPVNGKAVSFKVYVDTPVTTGTYIDFDAIVFLGQKDSYARILSCVIPVDAGGGANVGTLTVDHQLLTKPEPNIYHAATANDVAFQGDPVMHISGTTLTAIWLASYGSNTWANSSVAGGGNHTMTVYRRPAYFLPE